MPQTAGHGLIEQRVELVDFVVGDPADGPFRRDGRPVAGQSVIAALPREDMGGRHTIDSLVVRLFRAGPSMAQVIGDGGPIEGRRDAVVRQQRFDGRRQAERGAGTSKKQRHRAHAVASGHEPPFSPIPDHDRRATPQMGKHLDAPPLVAPQDKARVVERPSGDVEVVLEAGGVVQIPVEDTGERAMLGHRRRKRALSDVHDEAPRGRVRRMAHRQPAARHDIHARRRGKRSSGCHAMHGKSGSRAPTS